MGEELGTVDLGPYSCLPGTGSNSGLAPTLHKLLPRPPPSWWSGREFVWRNWLQEKLSCVWQEKEQRAEKIRGGTHKYLGLCHLSVNMFPPCSLQPGSVEMREWCVSKLGWMSQPRADMWAPWRQKCPFGQKTSITNILKLRSAIQHMEKKICIISH